MWKKLLRILLLVVIVVVAIYFPQILAWAAESIGSWFGMSLSAAVSAAIESIPLWASAAASLGLAYLVAPEATTDLVTEVGKGVGVVVDAAVDVASSAASSILSKFWPLALGGVALWILLSGKKDDDSDALNRQPGDAGSPEPEVAK